MNSTALGRRYAGALMDLGKQDGKFEQYGRELAAASNALTGGEHWHRFTSPLLPNEAKAYIIDELTKRYGWSDVVARFLKLLVDKKRIGVLASIVAAYAEMADQEAGRIHAVVTSAVDLDDAVKSRLTQKLKTHLNKQVILSSETDPDQIGGLKVRVGSTVIDGTVRGNLSRLSETLKKEQGA